MKAGGAFDVGGEAELARGGQRQRDEVLAGRDRLHDRRARWPASGARNRRRRSRSSIAVGRTSHSPHFRSDYGRQQRYRLVRISFAVSRNERHRNAARCGRSIPRRRSRNAAACRRLPRRRPAASWPSIRSISPSPTAKFFGVLGPNGAGKTTPIGILTTRVRITSGEALVAGANVATRAGRRPAAHRRRAAASESRSQPERHRESRLPRHVLRHRARRGDAARRASCWSGSASPTRWTRRSTSSPAASSSG